VSTEAEIVAAAIEASGPKMPTPAFLDAVARVKALAPSQEDICDALPAENAVEVVGVRGEKRIDYKGIRIKDASGGLNRSAKNLIDLHRPAAEAGRDITAKQAAGDYEYKPQHTAEVERKQPLAADVAVRIARTHGLTDVRALRPGRARYHGRSIRDENGVPNLWMDAERRLVRIALVGTRESSRVEVYAV